MISHTLPLTCVLASCILQYVGLVFSHTRSALNVYEPPVVAGGFDALIGSWPSCAVLSSSLSLFLHQLQPCCKLWHPLFLCRHKHLTADHLDACRGYMSPLVTLSSMVSQDYGAQLQLDAYRGPTIATNLDVTRSSPRRCTRGHCMVIHSRVALSLGRVSSALYPEAYRRHLPPNTFTPLLEYRSQRISRFNLCRCHTYFLPDNPSCQPFSWRSKVKNHSDVL